MYRRLLISLAYPPAWRKAISGAVDIIDGFNALLPFSQP
jgi:hypothetical protein